MKKLDQIGKSSFGLGSHSRHSDSLDPMLLTTDTTVNFLKDLEWLVGIAAVKKDGDLAVYVVLIPEYYFLYY